uniref:Ubiquitin-like protease family profile domain-containing protein n=1 Tax=Ditylenchus dipsaci TaxID=166011 RepID=A0A915E6R8_9BILA
MLKWTASVEVFDYDILILPIHTPGHWSLVVLNLEKERLVYYDSLHGDGTKHANLIKGFVAEYVVERGYATEDRSSYFLTVDPSNWLCCCPKQQNGFDCGVFVCKFAECVSRGSRMEYTQPQMAVIRKKIAEEILGGELF